MNTRDRVKQALQLEPAKRYELVEEILHSLDQPDPVIEAAWLEEAERRLAAHALAEGLTLVTNNEREFRRVPKLKIENWVV